MRNKVSIFLTRLTIMLVGFSCVVAAGGPAAVKASKVTVVRAAAGQPSAQGASDCVRYRRKKVRGKWRRICVERAKNTTPPAGDNTGAPAETNAADGVPAAAPHPPNWPNLDVLTNFPDPGKTCTLAGSANPATNPEKACSNSLKNRYVLPTGGFTPTLLSDMMKVALGDGGSAPACDSQNNRRAVSVVGYVRDVKVGGCAFGESCNCNSQHDGQCDAHIELVLDPNDHDPKGRGMVVVEVTERSRRLASMGLLQSNIGNDWSTPTLKGRLKGRWVRFSGWLYYDPDHHLESWQVDPQDNRSSSPGPHGQPKHDNWRSTCWEVHPVMAIEANVQSPS